MSGELWNAFSERVLRQCQKPGRYIGGEINSIRKDWGSAALRWGLLFPDLYEIGSSNLGISILYTILNRDSRLLAERFFVPAPDAASLMEQAGIPPLSLENRMPPSAFDVLGITLPYELTVTNILQFLRLAGVPARSAGRDFPLLIGGGAMAFNPLPLAPFFDAFVVGDGEEAVLDVSRALLDAGRDKGRCLDALAALPGVYVPARHDGTGVRVARRVVADLNAVDPGTPVVPLVESTFNRLSVEAARGCTRGCRFCFAGMTQRPYRERDTAAVRDYVAHWLGRTGLDEFSPSSLSITDHSRFDELFHCLWQISRSEKASLSLPSLRVGSVRRELAEKIGEFRKTGFTIAPETYPGLQAGLNKNVAFDAMEQDIRNALDLGWQNIKLYFMIGLPGEDMRGFAEIRDFVKSVLRSVKSGRANVTVSFSTFVPKPHTPLQWAPMNALGEIEEKQRLLKDLFFRERKIYLKLHNPRMSVIEGVIARGDAQAAGLIESACGHGARLDAWDEHFDFAIWERAAGETGVDLGAPARGFDLAATLPWEFIDAGVTREFLRGEYERYVAGTPTDDCRTGSCSNCGACDFGDLVNRFSRPAPVETAPDASLPPAEEPTADFLVIYEKKGAMRFLGTLDILRLWHRVFRIAGVPLGYSKGFNPQPRIDGGWAIPLGMESRCELLKFAAGPFDRDAVAAHIGRILPEGLALRSLTPASFTGPLDRHARRAEFLCAAPLSFDNRPELVVKRDKGNKTFLLADVLRELEPFDGGFRFVIELTPGGLKPLEFAAAAAGRDVTPFDLVKTRVFTETGAEIGT